MQLTHESRKAMWNNLNKRIENAHEEIAKLHKDKEGNDIPKDKLGGKALDGIKHLNDRILTMQMGLRLAFNTDWIREQRKEQIDTIAHRIKNELTLTVDETSKLTGHLNDLTRAAKCSKKHCWGRGYIGINVSLGEFNLCSCTKKTIDYYKGLLLKG